MRGGRRWEGGRARRKQTHYLSIFPERLIFFFFHWLFSISFFPRLITNLPGVRNLEPLAQRRRHTAPRQGFFFLLLLLFNTTTSSPPFPKCHKHEGPVVALPATHLTPPGAGNPIEAERGPLQTGTFKINHPIILKAFNLLKPRAPEN